MYFIKKGKKVVPTTNPDEVTKESFVIEPGGENRVWFKLELYEYDKVTGEKKAVVNQVMGENPGDFELLAPQWKRQGMTITMFHDPRPSLQADGVAEKLAKLNAQLEAEEAEKEKAKTKSK